MNINIFIFFITINFSKALKLNKSKLSNTVNGFNLRKGSNVALVTPMFENGKIDYESYDNLIKWQIKQGTQGIVILGSTGESCTINDDERNHLIKRARLLTYDKVSLIVGTGTYDTEKTKKYTINAMNMGVDACLIVTPYYNKPPQKALIKHYNSISNEIEKNSKKLNIDIMPILLYNIPTRTNINLEFETIKELSNNKCIAGIKECNCDLERLKNLKEIDNFLIYTGEDNISCEWVNNGADGVISVTANLFPKEMNMIMNEALIKNNYSYKINNILKETHKNLFIQSNPIPIKYSLKYINKIQSNYLREPLCKLEHKYEDKLKKTISDVYSKKVKYLKDI
jgi:4-hydroxy-tetrahydrodipicolinate synthase